MNEQVAMRAERIRELCVAGLEPRAIMDQMGLDEGQFWSICQRAGIRRSDYKTIIWTEERVAELQRLAAAGRSAGEMAKLLDPSGKDITRNSVIGKCKRMGVQLKPKAKAQVSSRFSLCPATGSIIKKRISKVANPPKPKRPKLPLLKNEPPTPGIKRDRWDAPPPPERTEAAIRIIDARPGQCRMPLWVDPARSGEVCGKKVVEGTSWCPDCYVRVARRVR